MAHIPQTPTAQLELVSFQQALDAANTPSPDYDIAQWIYAPNFYSEYRYILGTRGSNPLICVGINPSTARPDALDNTLKSVERIAVGNGFYSEYRYILGTRGSNPLICVGINPSTARPDALDNTLKSVERIAVGNGYDSFLMFNVYAQRATSPNDMEKNCNPLLHKENLEAFRYVLSLSSQPAVWAAWGAVIEKRSYLSACLRDMLQAGKECGANWYCAGAITKKGHPHHPLYLRKDEVLRPFDMDAYLEKL